MYTNHNHQILINESNWPGHVEKSSGSTGQAQGRTHDPVTAITAASGTNQATILRDENTGTKGLCDDCATALMDTAGVPVERYFYSPYDVAWYTSVVIALIVITSVSACGRYEETADASGEAAVRTPVPQRPADAPTPSLAVEPFSSQEARTHQEAWASHLGQAVEITNSIGMKLRLIPPGEFMMGSPKSEEGRFHIEGRQHRVQISQPFYLGVYEVTQSEYEQVMGSNPSHFARDRNLNVSGLETSRFPVENLSWEHAVEFCRRLSAMPEEEAAERVYRLPTEAEWEYGCRAGTMTPFYFGSVLDGRQANCNGNSPYGTTNKGPFLSRPTIVGSYSANGFGLYDMHGNVWEWVSDRIAPYSARSTYDDPGRVLRGGAWNSSAWRCRSAFRWGNEPTFWTPFFGFRVAFVTGGDGGAHNDMDRGWAEPGVLGARERRAVIPECAESGSDLATVTGKVTLDSQPLEGARVEFQPTCPDASSSYGTTDASGTYRLMLTDDRSGATPGEHTVRITKLVAVDRPAGEESGAMMEILPAMYNTQSKLRITVAPGLNTIVFDLISDGQ